MTEMTTGRVDPRVGMGQDICKLQRVRWGRVKNFTNLLFCLVENLCFKVIQTCPC